jgi:lipopolysaccharide transport system permease protein
MSLHFPATPTAAVGGLVHHRGLIWELVKRDFIGRYKGSIIGVAWSLLNPLFLLSVYTIFFSVVFKARWSVGAEESKVSFAIVLFAGMIVHGLFAECLNRAPSLIVSQPNYVKRVVFPLEVLPWVAVFSASLHFLVSLALLLIFCTASGVPLTAGLLLIPLVMLPLILMSIGLTWFFASLGVYLRDISQAMGFITTVLMFASPVFYQASSLPENYRWFLALNPLTLPIEQLRDVMLWGKGLDWTSWTTTLLIAAAVCHVGFWWFQKTRKGFADVL